MSWTQVRDHIYRDGQLLASNYPGEGDRHFSLDHLGTPRLVTASASSGFFYTLTPCRVLDTLSPSAPLTAGGTRTVQMVGACGIPSNATAVSVNITVVDASTQGEMTAYPANVSRPLASAISCRPGLARANNAVLKLGNGALNFYCNQPTGTANLIIDVNGYFVEGAGSVVAYHAYFPFGEEITSATQDAERMKFTGHERDFADPASVADDLDYMHARHYSPLTGRLLSVDPTLESADPFAPQSWNRYNYVQNKPLLYVDPTGELLVFSGSKENLEKLRELVNKSLYGYELKINGNGTAELVATNVQGPPTSEQAALATALSTAINNAAVVRVGVESGASDVLMGNYYTSKIDVQDIAAVGSGPGVSSASILAHEIIEQTARQEFNLPPDEIGYEKAHRFGIAAQDAVSGYSRGLSRRFLSGSPAFTGKTVARQSRGAREITVVIFWENGNFVKIMRQEF